MNKENNTYTLIYASVMVVLVALMLAFVSEALRPQQAKNEAIDKMQQILRSLNIPSTGKNAESLYNATITDAYLVDQDGNKSTGDAFATEPADELLKPPAERKYPVFEAIVDGNKKHVLALRGAGLWGPIWGFISLNDDNRTVYGVSFGHEGETPGLGGEIDKPDFTRRFQGKKIFDSNRRFTSIAIVKPGQTVAGKDCVDGVSGGTITSRGVDAMLASSLEFYVPFLIRP
jgi:Na+-transporting NADH:ubiquinone oxidoreductase subunit C